MNHDPRHLAVSDAPSWYVLVRSSELSLRKPIGAHGPDGPLVVWRGRDGRPVAFVRYCPHHGADLTLGRIAEGRSLRCCFHGWGFDDSGRCVYIPNTDRIPASANRTPRVLVERYGLIWIWHGSRVPLFDLPHIPEFESRSRVDRAEHRALAAPVSRILENALDTARFDRLDRVCGGISIDVLDTPCWSRDDDRWPVGFDQGAWFGVEVTMTMDKAVRFGITDRAAAVLGLSLSGIRIVNDIYPSISIQRVFIGERHINTVVAMASPFRLARHGEDADVQKIMMLNHTPRQLRGALRTALTYVLTSAQGRRLLRRDAAVWRGLKITGPGVPGRDDETIIAFRRWYAKWIDKTGVARDIDVVADSDEPRHFMGDKEMS